MPRPHRRVRAFTLIELLVVVVLIALVVALLLPAVQAAREAARRAQCVNNLKGLGIALHGFHATMNRFPPGYSIENRFHDKITPGWGWGFLALNQLEQQALYNAGNFQIPLSFRDQRTVIGTRLSAFLCPSTASGAPFDVGENGTPVSEFTEYVAPGNYVGSSGAVRIPDGLGGETAADLVRIVSGSGVLFLERRIDLAMVRAGSSTPFLVGERSRDVADATWTGVPATGVSFGTKKSWPVSSSDDTMFYVLGSSSVPETIYHGVKPEKNVPNFRGAGPGGFASQHPGGCNFLHGDGSVRFFKDGADPAVFRALATRAGGEAVSGGF